jgi:hypothetical protein
MNLYFFGWPSHLGGADTRCVHWLQLLHRHYRITVVPNEPERLAEQKWRTWMGERGIRALTWDRLPRRLRGWGLTFCNSFLLDGDRLAELRGRGLKFAWSNDMMWHFHRELGLVMAGFIDHIIYVSEAQRRALEPGYRQAWTALAVPPEAPLRRPGTLAGRIASPHSPGANLRWAITGNYIDPDFFPWVDRWTRRAVGAPLRIGRLSRPDPRKFPPDFPASYEGLKLKNPRYAVMGWTQQMADLWPRHRFSKRWTLLAPEAVPTVEFLQALDLFVYELSTDCQESWGRAVVEAMLTGAIPLVPAGGGHHLDQLVPHGQCGYHCETRADYGRYARRLEQSPALCARMSRAARHYAANVLNNATEHRRWWRTLFAGK